MPRIDLWYRFGRLLSKMFIPTFGSIEVVGRENLPKSGPLIIACNHQSNADPPIIVYGIDRPVYFMAKRGLFAGPVASYFLRSVHVYPVDRDGRDIDALRWAQGQLAQDRALLVFPEGTRSPGGLREGTDGLTYIALRTGAPVLPVAITGSELIPNMFRTPFHFKRLKVVIGEPFTLPPVEGRIARAELHRLTGRVMSRIAALLPPGYRGVYGGDPGLLPAPLDEGREAGDVQAGSEVD